MFKLFVFLALSVASCYGAPGHGTVCREIPSELTRCAGLPTAVSDEIQEKCRKFTGCQELTCTFRENNLLDGDVINKERTADFFDNYGQSNPSIATAVEYVKSACLGSMDLKPQATDLNCPVYDVIHCAYTNLVKHLPPSQWSTSPNCTRARAFAASCPICPDECFATQVPTGSCNACQSLSRSP